MVEVKKIMLNTTFARDIFPTCEQYIISAYASQELYLFGKIVTLSDKVAEPTQVKSKRNSKKTTCYVLPRSEGTIDELIVKYKDLIQRHIGVAAPYVGVYDFRTKQLIIPEVRLEQ